LKHLLIAGVDEAGRGCVIGPLVVGGVALKEQDIPLLTDLGVKDSKLLTPQKREKLYGEITKISAFYTIKLLPDQIDKVVASSRRLHKLNRLEAQTMAKVIDFLKPDTVYVDAADVVESRFGNHVSECLTVKAKVVSKHKADRIFPVVSAASIIAKVERDQEVADLRLKFGDFGSGYLTDEKTRRFLKECVGANGDFPVCVRRSWKPAKQVLSERGVEQKRLF
jgi:ribonuclease HII